MQKDIDNYIDHICNHIKWKNYHLAIKSELHNHINDSVNDYIMQDMTNEEAIDLTLQKIGDPDSIGEQLNEVYKPEFNKNFLTVFFVAITIFSFLQYITVFKITGDSLYIIKILFSILIGSFGAFALFCSDWSSNNKINKFILLLFWCLAIICIILNNIDFSNKDNIITGIILLFPPLCCCYIDRVRDKKIIGLILVIVMFSVPLFISYYINSFASMMVLTLNAWIVLLLIIKNTWLNFNRKRGLYLFISLPFASIIIFLLLKKLDNILLNAKGFFVLDVIKKSVIFGREDSRFLGTNGVTDYPLTCMIGDYGYIMLLVYILFFSLIVYEIIKIYDHQKKFISKLIIISVLVSLVTEFSFSLLLNLGIPLIKGLTVPFLDLNFGIIIKLIQLGLILKLECFGNYIFSNFSNNKLFDVEGGKIIIYPDSVKFN